MIKEEAKFETCDKCGHRECSRRNIYSCDCCDKKLEDDGESSLQVTVFLERKENEYEGRVIDMHFCDWKCLKNYLPTYLKRNENDINFVKLPYVSNKQIDPFIKNMIGNSK